MSSSRSRPSGDGLRVKEIQRTLRHALATQSTDTDSWLNGYQQDVAWLLAELELVEGALHDLAHEVHAVGSSMVARASAPIRPTPEEET